MSILPPVIRAAVKARADAPCQIAPDRRWELELAALAIFRHLSNERAGWGTWPSNLDEAAYVGEVLSRLFSQAADEAIL